MYDIDFSEYVIFLDECNSLLKYLVRRGEINKIIIRNKVNLKRPSWKVLQFIHMLLVTFELHRILTMLNWR